MSVTVEVTYDMSVELGTQRFEVEGAERVADVLRLTRERFGDAADRFDALTRITAVAVNGVLINYRKRMTTALKDGDRVSFVKAAAGG